MRPDPTLVQPLDGGRLYVGWRDPARNQAQIETFAPGEAARYDAFFAYLQRFADRLGISIFEPPPSLQHLVRNLTRLEDQEAFSRILFGNVRDLMDEFELAPRDPGPDRAARRGRRPGRALDAGHAVQPDDAAAVAGLAARGGAQDPRLIPLRGSTGLPVGGMGAIIDALCMSVVAHGGEIMSQQAGRRDPQRTASVRGIVTAKGEEYDAPIVISAVSPARPCFAGRRHVASGASSSPR